MIKIIERYKEKKEKKFHDTIYNEVFSYVRDCINGASYATVNNYHCEGRDRMVTIRRGTPCKFNRILECKTGVGLIFQINFSYFTKEEEFALFYYAFVPNENIRTQIENFHNYINRNFMKISNDN